MRIEAPRDIESFEETIQELSKMLQAGEGFFLIGGIIEDSGLRTFTIAHGMDRRAIKIINEISPVTVKSMLDHVVERLSPTTSKSLN